MNKELHYDQAVERETNAETCDKSHQIGVKLQKDTVNGNIEKNKYATF